MDQFLAELRKIPPVTRFVTGSSLAVTLSVIMKAVSPYTVLFVKKYVFKNFQVLLYSFNLSSNLFSLPRYGGFTPRSSWEVCFILLFVPEYCTYEIIGGGFNYLFELVML